MDAGNKQPLESQRKEKPGFPCWLVDEWSDLLLTLLWVRMLLGEGDGEHSLPQGCGVKRIQAKTQNVRKPYCALVSPSPLTRHSLHSHSAKSSRARVTAHNQCERKSMMELLDGSKCSNSRLEILRGVTTVTIPLRSCCGRPPGPPPGAAARRGRRGSWRSRPKPATRWGRHYELSVAVVVGGSWYVGNKRSRVGGVCYCCCPVGLARWRCQRRGPCESEHSRGSWAWKTQSKAETFGGRRGGQVGRGGENKNKEGKQERQGGRGGGGDVEGGSWNEEGRGTAELDACKIKDGDVIRSFGLQTAQQSDTRLSRTSTSNLSCVLLVHYVGIPPKLTHQHILTCLWDVWVQSLGLLEALTMTGSPVLQPILQGSGAPSLPWLGAWGRGRAATQGVPTPLCCLLCPLSLETHSRMCQLVGMEQPGSKSPSSWLRRKTISFNYYYNFFVNSNMKFFKQQFMSNLFRHFWMTRIWLMQLEGCGARLRWGMEALKGSARKTT